MDLLTREVQDSFIWKVYLNLAVARIFLKLRIFKIARMAFLLLSVLFYFLNFS